MSRRWMILVAALCVFGPSGAARADRVPPSLAEHLLEILRAEGIIGEQKYEELRKLAREEKRAQADVAARTPDAIRAGWKDGIFLEAPEHDFELQVGGRLVIDGAMANYDNDVKASLGTDDRFESGTEFRSARIYAEGRVAENVRFKAEYDFAGGDADFRDVYIELRGLPVLDRLRVGHFKEPLSMEEQTSSRFLTFMERSLANALVPARNTGFQVGGALWDERFTWALGAFRDTDEFGDGFGESEYNVTARLTGTPWYGDEGRRLLHLGLGYSHQFRSNDLVAFDSKPEAHLVPVDFVDTGEFASDGVDLLNPELALVHGPLSLQAEYVLAAVDASGGSTRDFGGFYVMASWLLTGEHRPYERAHGRFGRIRPANDFTSRGGSGAWELALRYSALDLDDDGISGGKLHDFTAGLNWYLNPFTRIVFNYVLADLDGVGDTHIFQSRFQVDF